MIRPVTCVCALLAGASGLYLYQAKHSVQLLDRQIENTVRATQAARERSGVLRAEWTLRNDPERLAQLASRFLQLKTVTPGQFTTLAELGNRLPPVQDPNAAPPDAAPAEPTQDTIALAPETMPVQQASAQVASLAPKPETPKPAPLKVIAAAKSERPAERKAAQLALASFPPPRSATRSVVRTTAAFGAVPAPVPLARPISVSYAQPGRAPRPALGDTPAPVVGSSLGFARTVLAPPVPVPAYNAPNGN